MNDCVFCKIVSGTVPSAKVYEDEHTLAFLDINPISLGHTLVITRNHYEQLTDVPAEELGRLIRTTQRIAAAVIKGAGAEGFNLVQSNGACAAQIVPHVHFHLVPRRRYDGLHFVTKRLDIDDEERVAVLDKIRAHL